MGVISIPAVVSHYLLAERVFNSLTEYNPDLKLNHTAFLWGAYGPDIFFSHRIMPWQKQKSLSYLSKKMHSMNADKILNFIMSYAKNRESDTAKSYAFGFVTHYSFDSVAHPFILYFSDIMSKQKNNVHTSICHNDIEANLDTLFLKYETKQKITSFKLQKTSPIDKHTVEVIADVLYNFFITFGFEKISKQDIIQTQYDWHNSLVLLNDRTQIKKPLVKFCEKLLNISPMLSPIFRVPYPDLSFDYANMNHSQWYKYGTELHNENFFDLVNISQELSLKLISILNSGKMLTYEQCSDSFSGTFTV